MDEVTPISSRIAKLALTNKHNDIFDTSFGDIPGVEDLSLNEEDWTIDAQDMLKDLTKPMREEQLVKESQIISTSPPSTVYFSEDNKDEILVENSKNEEEENHASNDVESRERQESLRKELRSIKKVNEALEQVTNNLKQGVGKMKDFQTTIKQTEQLLGLWVRILSQSEHTQRILLEGQWQGASKDLEDVLAEQQQIISK